MHYVTMVDRFLSGWGPAIGKVNVLIFECEDLEEAETVMQNGKEHDEMSSLAITTEEPEFDESAFFVQHKDRLTYPKFYRRE